MQNFQINIWIILLKLIFLKNLQYNCWQVMWDTMGIIKKNTEFKQKYGEAALGKATELFYRETWENHEPNF